MTNSRKQPTRLSILGILLACVLILPAVAQETPSITVARVKGAVEVSHAVDTAGEWVAVSAGNTIGAGWRLRTGADAKAQLVFPRDNVVILKANSVLYVDKLDAGGGAELEAGSGGLLVDLANALAPGSEFELETPTALAVVRGTKYGAEDIDDDDVTFHGYSGVVDIYDSEGENGVSLFAGFSVGVAAGMPPSAPEPSGDEADEFLGDAEDTESFELAEAALAPVIAELSAILARLQEPDTRLADLEDEWARYERHDQFGQMLLLYAQGILPLGEQVDEEAAWFDTTIEGVDAESLGDTAGSIQLLLADLYARLDDLSADATSLIEDNQDLLDYFSGLIPSGDPTLGLRWGLMDTDGDGLSDVDEITLGTDPVLSNADDGFFDLLAPDDGEIYEYPTDRTITFEFEPLDGDFVLGYDLLIESGGEQWLRNNVEDSEIVSPEIITGPGAVFSDMLVITDEITLDWKVVAQLDPDIFFSRGTSQLGAGGLSISSNTRQIVIEKPVLEPADLYLVPEIAGAISVEDTFRVRCVIEDVTGMAGWEITVLYDPSVMAFETGRKLGLLGGATLFFSDLLGGVVVISGVIPTGDTGVTGTGDLFELEFIATDEGLGTIEISDATLRNIADGELPVELGDEVDVEIEATLGASDVPGRNDQW